MQTSASKSKGTAALPKFIEKIDSLCLELPTKSTYQNQKNTRKIGHIICFSLLFTIFVGIYRGFRRVELNPLEEVHHHKIYKQTIDDIHLGYGRSANVGRGVDNV